MVFIALIMFCITSVPTCITHDSEDIIENPISKEYLAKSRAKVGVRSFLKRHYLKDPDSYEGISWDAFGVYSKENNTYFVLHTYRAKNSFGGYVVEEKLFVLDSDGNVINIVDDMNEIINGY